MIFAQGVDAGPGGSLFAIVAAGFLVCAFVTWGVYWGYRKIVTPRYPRFNRAVGWAAWALVVIFAIVVLVWWQASRSWNQFFLFFPMCLGIGASILAVGVCAACRLLNGLTRRQNGTTYVPNPTLGGGLAIAAVAMLATLGLLCLAMVMPNVWMGVIVGIICPVGMLSAATASMLPTNFWKGALVTLLSCVISALPATLVYVPLYWFSQHADVGGPRFQHSTAWDEAQHSTGEEKVSGTVCRAVCIAGRPIQHVVQQPPAVVRKGRPMPTIVSEHRRFVNNGS